MKSPIRNHPRVHENSYCNTRRRHFLISQHASTYTSETHTHTHTHTHTYYFKHFLSDGTVKTFAASSFPSCLTALSSLGVFLTFIFLTLTDVLTFLAVFSRSLPHLPPPVRLFLSVVRQLAVCCGQPAAD